MTTDRINQFVTLPTSSLRAKPLLRETTRPCGASTLVHRVGGGCVVVGGAATDVAVVHIAAAAAAAARGREPSAWNCLYVRRRASERAAFLGATVCARAPRRIDGAVGDGRRVERA